MSADQRIAKLEEALRWYGEEAEALARKVNGKRVMDNPNAIEASLVVLALDGGRRAREALSVNATPSSQKPTGSA